MSARGVDLSVFNTLAMSNAADMLHKMRVYCECAESLASIGDFDGWCRAGEKLLVEARAFSAHLKEAKRAPVTAKEVVEQLHAEALASMAPDDPPDPGNAE